MHRCARRRGEHLHAGSIRVDPRAHTRRGTDAGSLVAGAGRASFISSRMCSRPALACSSALAMSGKSSPSHLMSSWKAVIASASPATYGHESEGGREDRGGRGEEGETTGEDYG